MKYYIDPQNKLFAYESDGSQDAFIPAGQVPATPAQVQAAQNPTPTAAQLWSNYKATAQAALDKSDVTMLRCIEASVAVPAAWNTYRKALRVIVAATSGDPSAALPTRPAFPAGT